MAILPRCPECGLESSELRCPRCNALKVANCDGRCAACAIAGASSCGVPMPGGDTRPGARNDESRPGRGVTAPATGVDSES